jgi:hypothetical protein
MLYALTYAPAACPATAQTAHQKCPCLLWLSVHLESLSGHVVQLVTDGDLQFILDHIVERVGGVGLMNPHGTQVNSTWT